MSLIIAWIVFLVAYFVRKFRNQWEDEHKTLRSKESYSGSVAIFHPFCNDCGGGERVLWFMVMEIQTQFPSMQIKIYICDETDPDKIIQKAQTRFNIDLKLNNIELYPLSRKKLILPSTWPYFTLFGQTLGSIILACEALKYPMPDAIIDTTGFVFFGAILKIFGAKKYFSYVHYPTISTDMISNVLSRSAAYNNSQFIAKFSIITYIKWLYYNIFALWYWLGGYSVNFVACNSRWTHNHIKNLWRKTDMNSEIVYPPCSPQFFKSDAGYRNRTVLSISQFRPEKDHIKQIDIAAKLLANRSDMEDAKFILAGSIRSNSDEQYLESLRRYAKEKGVEGVVEFQINKSFDELSLLMREAFIGLHTMNQEHFGIGIVEMMASGLIVIAHNSGGPRSDIMVDFNDKPVGFLATSVDEYCKIIEEILNMDQSKIEGIRKNAAASVHSRFSDVNFNVNINRIIENLVL